MYSTPTVRQYVAQHAEQVAERHLRLAADLGIDAGVRSGQELAVEVPNRQAVGRRIELGVHLRLFDLERVEIGDQVTAHTMHVDELIDLRLLLEQRRIAVHRVDVATPLDGLVGHVERPEDVDVEVVLTEQQFVHLLEEHARFGALNDAVVIGRGERDHLRHAEFGQLRRVGGLELGWEGDAADPDDQTLARHQPRYRLECADRARVGEAHGRAAEVVDAQLAVAGLTNQALVLVDELLEVERVGRLDARHRQGAAAVWFLQIDGDTEPDVRVLDQTGLPCSSAV